MNYNLFNSPLIVKLPPKIELTFYLIKAELKNIKFTDGLNKAGIDSYINFLDFSPLIASMIGLKNHNCDEFSEWYFHRQLELVKKVDMEDDQVFLEKAIDFYVDLIVKKRELAKTGSSTYV